KPVQKAPAKKSADSKVKASTKTEPVPAAKPAASPAKAAPKKVKKEKAPSPLPKSAPAKKLVSTPASAPKVTVASKTQQPQKKAEQPKKKAPAPKKKAKPAGLGQKALAQKAAADKPAKNVKPAAKPSPKVAQKQEAPTKKKTATSRFRRSAASNKIKGTLVAEFPKRLVVKYKSSRYRDPFKTLIDAARTQNVPVEQRIANVEGLKLVGIIESDGGSNRALFEDQEGYGYMLESGDKVRNGYVLRVETDRVYFQIFEYGWSRTVALKMD
ncbi:MAG: hypothetical protein GY841_23355, partial [FCB group bacterium]|nr:hypothetical protein [FCB group bacterium]